MIGMLATSKAGHDCKEVFVIVREEEEYVYLADGKARSLAKPKRKNKKHIQLIKKNKNEEWQKFRCGNKREIENWKNGIFVVY